MSPRSSDWWYDEAAGPLVRPYALVSGRTRPTWGRLNLATQVRAIRTSSDTSALSVEHLEILRLCRKPLSVAEVAAYLHAPLVVAKVLLSDLIQRGDVITSDASRMAVAPDRNLLQKVLDGVRAI
ncbi:hypothetical protein UK23_27250 [Lentzea aerocolonigenes]|uniref:DUF742 domain-containing protein n=1 Tax=Lentzea aerocolonigenes TaxID=68170 RepID=A0A0F0GNN5_LENAE|nr:DUF742 domain-containing protein [Lentzea aerocolonigenes]KJK45109.1 hypothetical protein UK23_27250 [Lentzea aerocolonigenes]